MCNIAGYVGTRQAAPILIGMLRQQEGLDAGFYTGIATLHQGKIHYAKLTGDLDRLTALTEAAKLPGTVGIIHGRTRSGGGDEWAHPFVGERNGEARIAYVANGNAACFTGRKEESAALAQSLCDAGFPMAARLQLPEHRYISLADGSAVHMSDVMCQLILKKVTEGMDTAAAMAEAFCQAPAGIVGLALNTAEPGSIAWSRIDRPMMVAHAGHGTYLASAALALPEDAGAPTALPANSAGFVTASGWTAAPYKNPPVQVDDMDAGCFHRAYEAVLAALEKEPQQFYMMARLVKETVFPGAPCPPHALLAYEVLRALLKEDKVTRSVIRLESDFENIDAPRFVYSLK